jgi:hypothetical protein
MVAQAIIQTNDAVLGFGKAGCPTQAEQLSQLWHGPGVFHCHETGMTR